MRIHNAWRLKHRGEYPTLVVGSIQTSASQPASMMKIPRILGQATGQKNSVIEPYINKIVHECYDV
jgi:hypothetical protein